MVGQMSDVIIGGTNVGVGQMSGGTNVRWDKCRSDKRRWHLCRSDKSRATILSNSQNYLLDELTFVLINY